MASPALGSYILGSTRTLKVGSSGQDVSDLQTVLNILFQGRQGQIPVVNGIYGSETKASVVIFQQGMGIAVDGVFGKDSRTALAALWNAAANGADRAGAFGSSVLQRLRTAVGAMSPVSDGASVPGVKTVGGKPAISNTIVGPENPPPAGALVLATALPGTSLWARMTMPVTIPFIEMQAPRWTIIAAAFGVTGAVLAGLSKLARRR